MPSSTFAPMRNFGWDESRKINFLGAASWHSMIDASQSLHIASGSFGSWESQPCLSGMWGMIQMFGTEVNSWKVLVLGSTRSEVGQRSFPYSTLPPARVLPEWREPASFRFSEKVESVFGFFANYEEGVPEANRVYMPIGVDELMRGSCVDLPWPLTRGGCLRALPIGRPSRPAPSPGNAGPSGRIPQSSGRSPSPPPPISSRW